MQYYEDAQQEAIDYHDPEVWDGREWDELTQDEQIEIIEPIAREKLDQLVGYAEWVNKGGIRGLDKEGAKGYMTFAMKDDSLCRFSREDVDFMCERAEVSRESIEESNKRCGNTPLKEK